METGIPKRSCTVKHLEPRSIQFERLRLWKARPENFKCRYRFGRCGLDHFDVLPEAESSADLLHIRARGFVAPCGAFMPLAAGDDVVELNAVGAGAVIVSLFDPFEPVQTDCGARKILISLAFYDVVALGDDLAVDDCFHDLPSLRVRSFARNHYKRFMRKGSLAIKRLIKTVYPMSNSS